MDVLSDILNTLNFKGSLYFSTELTAPWGIKVPRYQNVVHFHLAIGGDFWIKPETVDKAIHLNAGDMIIIPHGLGHDLLDQPATEVRPLNDVLERSHYDGSGHLVYGAIENPQQKKETASITKMVCGYFSFDQDSSHPLIEELPDYILITGQQAMDFSWFHNAMNFTSYESDQSKIGSAAIIKRLSEILFIHAVRVWSTDNGQENGFIKGICDEGIGRSLRSFHKSPQEKWTVERLASEAGLSRSGYASRFKELMQMPPLGYITFWRMQKACMYLRADNTPVETVAINVGYQSVAAFSKIFKRTVGIGPGKYRKMAS